MTVQNTVVLILVSVALISQTATAWVQMSRTTIPSSTSSNLDLRFSSRISGFGGQVVLLGPSSSLDDSTLTMKKGKSNIPPMMRKQYERQKEMNEMRKQMVEASTVKDDGLPVFNLYVRSKKVKMWYPCGSFKGDARSGGLAKNYVDKNLMAGMSKSQLDSGIGASVFKDVAKLTDSVCRSYPQLRKAKDELEWGYRLGFAGLDEKTEPINMIELKEQKGLIDNIKGMFGGDDNK